jgi:hypothetical protein
MAELDAPVSPGRSHQPAPRMARRPIAFVLSGGGSQGSFEVGVLRYSRRRRPARRSWWVRRSVRSSRCWRRATTRRRVDGRSTMEAIWRSAFEPRHVADRAVARQVAAQANWASEPAVARRACARQSSAGRLADARRGRGIHPRRTEHWSTGRDAGEVAAEHGPVRTIVEGRCPWRMQASGLTLRGGGESESGELHYLTSTAPRTHAMRPLMSNCPVHDAVLRLRRFLPPAYPAGREHPDGACVILRSLAQSAAPVTSSPWSRRRPVDSWMIGDRGRSTRPPGLGGYRPDETLRKEIDPPRLGSASDGDRP